MTVGGSGILVACRHFGKPGCLFLQSEATSQRLTPYSLRLEDGDSRCLLNVGRRFRHILVLSTKNGKMIELIC